MINKYTTIETSDDGRNLHHHRSLRGVKGQKTIIKAYFEYLALGHCFQLSI